ncbi:MAG: helix-turn-helix domain-containing protein [Myxococcota bacterium]|nr:helix-turn-helix domain-containing protein [Myxococcota bacterium]
MEDAKRKKLAAGGWKVGSAEELLGLSSAEAGLVEVRVRLAHALRSSRVALGLSQEAFASRMGSSQSRVAKMEAGDPTVSIDLILSGLFEAGATMNDVARALRTKAPTPERRGATKNAPVRGVAARRARRSAPALSTSRS